MVISFGETFLGGIYPASSIRLLLLTMIVLLIVIQAFVMRTFFHCDSIMTQQNQQAPSQRQQKQLLRHQIPPQQQNVSCGDQSALLKSDLQKENETFQENSKKVIPTFEVQVEIMTAIKDAKPSSESKGYVQVPEEDGTFNGYPIYLRQSASSKVQSSIHCVGDNFRDDAWIHRSCQFRRLCFDTKEREFVVFSSATNPNYLQHKIQDPLNSRTSSSLSTSTTNNNLVSNTSSIQNLPSRSNSSSMSSYSSLFSISNHMMNADVSIGGINTKWTWSRGVPRLRWFPRIISSPLEGEYYELDKNIVMVPFHSFFAQNPGSYNHQILYRQENQTHTSSLLSLYDILGHLVWDDFLPIYTLLRMFNLFQDDGYKPLLLRYVLPGSGMWATCDMDYEKKTQCHNMYRKFLPLFGLHGANFSSTHDFILKTKYSNRSSLVCASHAAAGLGMLTDHGYKLHGWHHKDYESMHNHGRGSLLYDFRNFMVRNVGLNVTKVPSKPPYIITFAESTSRSTLRDYNFKRQIQVLQAALGNRVHIQRINFAKLSVLDQVKIATESSIYVTACGGGAVTATFLSRGATAILYYVETGGIESNRKTGQPARLDWDIFNNMAWIRTHWLPAGTMNNSSDITLFLQLVTQELDVMDDQW
jgi:hypothetical protein